MNESEIGEEEDLLSVLSGGEDHTRLQYFRSSGQWERAREVVVDLLAGQPDSGYLHRALGECLRHLGDYEAGERALQRALALLPDDAETLQELALLYLQQGRSGLADDMVRRALALEPNDETNWAILGHLCLGYQDYRQALECADQLLRLSPGDPRALEIRAKALREVKGAEQISAREQLAAMQELLEISPDSAYAHCNVGVVYFDELKDYESAEWHFREAVRLEPEKKVYQKLLIKALRKRDAVLRLLWMPFMPVMWILNVINWSWAKKWPLIGMIFVFKYLVVIGVALALFFFAVVWPVTKIYEYLTIADVHRKMGRLAIYSGPLARLHRAPFGLRFLLFLGILVVFWGLVFTLLAHDEYGSEILQRTGLAVAAGVVLVFLWGGALWLRDGVKKRRLERKNRKLRKVTASNE